MVLSSSCSNKCVIDNRSCAWLDGIFAIVLLSGKIKMPPEKVRLVCIVEKDPIDERTERRSSAGSATETPASWSRFKSCKAFWSRFLQTCVIAILYCWSTICPIYVMANEGLWRWPVSEGSKIRIPLMISLMEPFKGATSLLRSLARTWVFVALFQWDAICSSAALSVATVRLQWWSAGDDSSTPAPSPLEPFDCASRPWVLSIKMCLCR